MPCLPTFLSRLLPLLFAVFFTASTAHAQVFGVRTNVTATTVSPYLEDYGRDNNLLVTLFYTGNDVEYTGLLRMTITGDNYRLVTAEPLFMQPITLRRGQPLILRGSRLADHFNINNLRVDGVGGQAILENGGALPDGPITICAEFYDVNRFDELVSAGNCAFRFVQQNYPPEVVMPQGDIRALPTNVVNFSWTPRHVPNVLADEYELSIWEKVPGLTYDQIINSTGPIRDPIITRIPRYTFTNYDAPLEVGQDYIWRVQVRDRRNVREFLNFGISDFGEFRYGTEDDAAGPGTCALPQGLFAQGVTSSGGEIGWEVDELVGITGFTVRYRPTGTQDWQEGGEAAATDTRFTLSNLNRETDYEAEVCATCTDGSQQCAEVPFLTLEATTPEGDCVNDAFALTGGPVHFDFVEFSWPDLAAAPYRVSVSEWGGDQVMPSEETTETDFRVGGLEPLRTYDVSVCFGCENTEICDTITLTTTGVDCALAGDFSYDYECGAPDGLDTLNIGTLLTELHPGDSIWAGDFLVEVGEATASGTVFSGHGFTKVPLLRGAKLRMEFREIEVNESCRMVGGEMAVVSPIRSALERIQDMVAGLTDLINDLDDVLGQISQALGAIQNALNELADSVENQDAINELLDAANAAITQIPYISEDLIEELEEAEDCLRRATRQQDQAALDACQEQYNAVLARIEEFTNELFNAPFQVEFVQAPLSEADPVYGYDKLKYASIPNPYVTHTIAGEEYKVPWASTQLNGNAPGNRFVARRAGGGELTDVFFVDDEEARVEGWTPNGSNTEAIHEALEARRHKKTRHVFAAIPRDTTGGKPPVYLAGQISIVSYKTEEATVHIVPVNDVQLPTDQAFLQRRMNEIYHPAVVDIEVIVEAPLSAPDFDGTLDNVESHPLTNYGPEMIGLRRLVKQQSYHKAKDYYLLVVDNMLPEARNGFMPRKRHYGFLDASDLGNAEAFARVAAHELGHGAWHLQHPKYQFPGAADGGTELIMDVDNDGTEVVRYQWGEVHDPVANFTLFEEGGEGESVMPVPSDLRCLPPGYNGLSEINTYLDPDSNLIVLGNEYTPVAFLETADTSLENGSLAIVRANQSGAYYSWSPNDGGSSLFYRMLDRNILNFNDSINLSGGTTIPALVVVDDSCVLNLYLPDESLAPVDLDGCDCSILDTYFNDPICDRVTDYQQGNIDDRTRVFSDTMKATIELEIDTVLEQREWQIIVDILPANCNPVDSFYFNNAAEDTIQLLFIVDVDTQDSSRVEGVTLDWRVSTNIENFFPERYLKYVRDSILELQFRPDSFYLTVRECVKKFRSPLPGDCFFEMRVVGTQDNDRTNHTGGMFGCSRGGATNCRSASFSHFPFYGQNKEKAHNGMDMYAALDTDIFSMFDGTITRIVSNVAANTRGYDPDPNVTGPKNYFGNKIFIRHNNTQHGNEDYAGSIITLYTHLNSVENLAVGDHVSQGQKLGESGRTGNAMTIQVWRRHSHINVYEGTSVGNTHARSAADFFYTQFDHDGNITN